jgi:hypothetical protein
MCAIHAYLSNNISKALHTDELLRAEWVARVSALDLYVHEFVAQRMLQIFEKSRPAPPAFMTFKVPLATLDRIRSATTPFEASLAFDLEVRKQHSLLTFQDPEKIADALRICSTIELWNTIAMFNGATEQTKIAHAKMLKRQLSQIVERRNKIAHEGDLQPGFPRTPWPITQPDLTFVSTFLRSLVAAMESIA